MLRGNVLPTYCGRVLPPSVQYAYPSGSLRNTASAASGREWQARTESSWWPPWVAARRLLQRPTRLLRHDVEGYFVGLEHRAQAALYPAHENQLVVSRRQRVVPSDAAGADCEPIDHPLLPGLQIVELLDRPPLA